MLDYPSWVCRDCAYEAGGKIPYGHISSWHEDKCPCCGFIRPLTEPRDFGYPPLKVRDGAVNILGSTGDRTNHHLGGNGQSQIQAKQSSKGDISTFRRIAARSRKLAGTACSFAIKAVGAAWKKLE